uniref:Uncharacterized protein n=1 Tax=Arundo donax TaxID=35708 RepID=A0A0A9ANP8_ARUDO
MEELYLWQGRGRAEVSRPPRACTWLLTWMLLVGPSCELVDIFLMWGRCETLAL